MIQTYARTVVLSVLLLVSGRSASAFSLLGPFDTWQTGALGYNFTGDIGGPMGITEDYRWSYPTLCYAFSPSFLNYFGTNGVNAVDQAFKILNDLPPASKMSASLGEFPLDTMRINYQAQALGMLDVKSVVLSLLVEQLGVADAIRYTWTLRSRTTVTSGGVTFTNYTVIKRNFDPVTLQPTAYVNSVLYTYTIGDPLLPNNYAEALETPATTLPLGSGPVSSFLSNGSQSAGVFSPFGAFFIGLTRDDVGAIRYTLRTSNYNVENQPPNTTASSTLASSPYLPVILSNAVVITNITTFGTALRPGREHMRFIKGRYDSIFGQQFITFTNRFTDAGIFGNRRITQTLARVITAPDILFDVGDLGVNNNGVPLLITRNSTFANNSGLNRSPGKAGPGVMNGPITITLTSQLPFLFSQVGPNDPPASEATGLGNYVWGSFDGSSKPPIVYPDGYSVSVLEQQVLSGH